MISPFEVYVVMQLDSVKLSVMMCAFVMLVILCITSFLASLDDDWQIHNWKKAPQELTKPLVLVWRERSLVCLVVLLALQGLLPSSRTAAAMILVPALTSKEVTEPIGREAAELYALAKQALANLAKPDGPAPEKRE